MVLDWHAFGPASPASPGSPGAGSASGETAADEATPQFFASYLEAHGVGEALRAAIDKIVNASPRPADPVAALGRLLSAEAAAKEPDAALQLTDAVGAIDLGE